MPTRREPAEPLAALLEEGTLDELGRWMPKKELALLAELCERGRNDAELARPALLLAQAYAKRVARLLDQDPLPAVTREIEAGLARLSLKDGL